LGKAALCGHLHFQAASATYDECKRLRREFRSAPQGQPALALALQYHRRTGDGMNAINTVSKEPRAPETKIEMPTFVMRRAKTKVFDNPALWALFAYYLANLVNDPVNLWLGLNSIFTPKQFALVFGIAFLIFEKGPKRNSLFRNSMFSLIAFYAICLTSYTLFLVAGKASEGAWLGLLTTGINILWLFVVGNVLSRGLTARDARNFIGGMLILGLIPLLSGLYEISQGQSILRGYLPDKWVGLFFYIRGFHIDKVDFVTALAPAIISGFILISHHGVKKHWYLLPYLGASLVCVFKSFSTTGIIGLTGALLFLAFLNVSRTAKIYFIILLALGVGVVLAAINTQGGQFLVEQYTDKYEKQTQLAYNPRFVYGAICFRAFLGSPIWGVGFGNHQRLIDQEVHGWAGGGGAHSIMKIPADLGLIGSIPFFLFWIILYSATFRSFRAMSFKRGDEHSIMVKFSLGFSIFVLARLILYFHGMAGEAFILWPAFAYATHGGNLKSPAASSSWAHKN
jgi:O-Antigen ligase